MSNENISDPLTALLKDLRCGGYGLIQMDDSDAEIKALVAVIALRNRVKEWSSLADAGLRLRCGELSSQEIRTVRAVLSAISGPINEISKP